MGRVGAGGFTLVEILLGVAAGAIGLVATMAIPAYKDHGVRAQVNDLVIAAAKCRNAVTEYYTINGRFPDSAKSAGCPDNVPPNDNPLAVYEGEILVQAVGPLAEHLGRKNMFAFRAVCAGGSCEGAPIQAWSCSSTGQVASSTTIPEKYLPSSCR